MPQIYCHSVILGVININKTSGKETVMFLWLKFIAGDYLIGDRRGQNLSHQQRLAALHPERGWGEAGRGYGKKEETFDEKVEWKNATESKRRRKSRRITGERN